MATASPDNSTVTQAEMSAIFDADDVNITRYQYRVSKQWLEDLRMYLDQKCDKPPGSVAMNPHVTSQNKWVPGDEWVNLVEKWGLCADHELDRYTLDQTDQRLVECEVAMLSPYTHYLEHRKKSFSLLELVGYIECQVRQILHVPKERNSRLWFAATVTNNNEQDPTKSVPAQFTPCLNRQHRLQDDVPSSSTVHMLALELQDLNGLWPSGFSGNPKGELTEFMMVFDRGVTREVWPEVKVSETAVLEVALQQAEALSAQTRHRHCAIEKGLKAKEETLTKLLSRHKDNRTVLQEKRIELDCQEQDNATRATEAELAIRKITTEEMDFNEQLYYLYQLNKVHSDVITLNIGGQCFQVPLKDLVKHKSSLFGVLFSGRYHVRHAVDGTVFIDRDPTYFKIILQYLNRGTSIRGFLPQTKEDITDLLKEAKYYKLWDLVHYLDKVRDGLPSMHQDEDTSKDESVANGKRCGVMWDNLDATFLGALFTNMV